MAGSGPPDNPDAKKSKRVFFCGTCKHGIFLRRHSRKIICVQTLDFHDKDNIASCEHAKRKE